MYLTENVKYVPMFSGYDLSTHDTLMTSDSINMKNFHHATVLVQFDDIGTASPILYFYAGASDGALTSALTFNYAFGSAACGSASADVLGAWSTSAALTIVHGTYDNYLLVVEISAAMLTAAGNTYDWLTANFTDPSTGCTGQVTMTAILQGRYSNNVSLTALT